MSARLLAEIDLELRRARNDVQHAGRRVEVLTEMRSLAAQLVDRFTVAQLELAELEEQRAALVVRDLREPVGDYPERVVLDENVQGFDQHHLPAEPEMPFAIVGADDLDPLGQSVLALVTEHGPVSPKWVADQLVKNRRDIGLLMREMNAAGVLSELDGTGFYDVPDREEAQAA